MNFTSKKNPDCELVELRPSFVILHDNLLCPCHTLGQRISLYIKILYPVAKSHDGQIWETDCTHERTCNEHGPVATNKERT